MKRVALGAALLGATLTIGLSALSPQPKALPKILYVTQSAGFKHDVLPLSEELLPQIGARERAFDVTVAHDVSVITAEGLRPYGAVVFYTTGELPMSDAQKTAFMDFIKGGRGFVGIHSATDTFYKWPEYGEMIGGYFDEHPWNTTVTMKVEVRDFPATKHLGPTWTIADEIYQFRNYTRKDKTVLLSLDTSSVDLKAKGVKRTDGDFANAWYKTHGNGRVFYTALGHRPEVWRDPAFQKHLAGGITWVLSGGQ